MSRFTISGDCLVRATAQLQNDKHPRAPHCERSRTPIGAFSRYFRYPMGMFRFAAALCLASILGFAQAQPPQQAPPPGPDPMKQPDVYNYTITAAKLGKWEAANDHLVPYYQKNSPDISKVPGPRPGEIQNMDQMTTWTRAHYREMARIIEQYMGLKEYLIMGLVLNFSLSVNSARERGYPVPPEYHVNEANVAFVKANKDKITELFHKYQIVFAAHQ